MTNIVRVTVLSTLLIVLATSFSVSLAEAGSIPILEISMEPSGEVEMKFEGISIDMIEPEEDTPVNICNKFNENVQLIIRVDGTLLLNLTLKPNDCTDDILPNDLALGDSLLPGGGTQYKVGKGSILIDGCSVVPEKPTRFSLGTCPGVQIGGEIIPIDSTALLLAGVQANYSILTILAVVGAGSGFAALKLKRKFPKIVVKF